MIARYTRPGMGRIFSDENRFAQWLEVELAASEALAETGEVPADAARALRAHASFEVARIHEIEREVKHDVIAFTTAVSEKMAAAGAAEASRWLHYGLTSNDIVDTAQALVLKQASELLIKIAKRCTNCCAAAPLSSSRVDHVSAALGGGHHQVLPLRSFPHLRCHRVYDWLDDDCHDNRADLTKNFVAEQSIYRVDPVNNAITVHQAGQLPVLDSTLQATFDGCMGTGERLRNPMWTDGNWLAEKSDVFQSAYIAASHNLCGFEGCVAQGERALSARVFVPLRLHRRDGLEVARRHSERPRRVHVNVGTHGWFSL